MATRSSARRSGGAESDKFNKATIHLLPIDRVKKELAHRNLPIVGSLGVLRDRLQLYCDGLLDSSTCSPSLAPTTKTTKISPSAAKGTRTKKPQATPRGKRKAVAKVAKKEEVEEEEEELKKEPEGEEQAKDQACSLPPVLSENEDDPIEEGFEVCIPNLEPQFDDEDDEPLLKVSPKKVSPFKKKRKRQSDLYEEASVLTKGDTDYVPEEVKEVPKKRTRRPDDVRKKVEVKEDPRIDDSPQSRPQESRACKDTASTSTEREPFIETRKVKERPSITERRPSIVVKEKTKKSEGNEKEKERVRPVTAAERYAQIMLDRKKNQEDERKKEEKKALTVEEVKKETKEKTVSFQQSTGTVNSHKKTEGGDPRVFLLPPRKKPFPSANPAPSRLPTNSAESLLDNLLEVQQHTLKKVPKSSAETEAEKLRVISEMKERARVLNKEMLSEEKKKVKVETQDRKRSVTGNGESTSTLQQELTSTKECVRETAAVKREVEIRTPECEPLHFDYSAIAELSKAMGAETKRRVAMDRKGEQSLVAPIVPSLQHPFLQQLSTKLAAVYEERSKSPVQLAVEGCMEDMVKRVERRLEKEGKWEKAAKRKSLYPSSGNEESLSNPREFLAKASGILQNLSGGEWKSVDDEASNSPIALHIRQEVVEDYVEEEKEKELPEFHGEPVPSDDDEALFLEAAGLPKKEKKPKHVVVEEEAPPSHENIELDYYNACLHIKGATDKSWLIDPENGDGLALMWGGVKTNHGFILPIGIEKGKKIVFQMKIIEHLSIRHLPFREQEAFDVRFGFSLRSAPNILGEFAGSWCYSTTGKKATNNVFVEWGDPADIGDVLTAELDSNERTIVFYKNDERMGTAFTGIELPEGEAVFPHICPKNCKVAVNLGDFPEVEGGWGERRDDWIFPCHFDRKALEMSKLPPSDKANCTLLMMVGLPGVGKTTWVRQYIRDHPDETWNVISAEAVMAAMKVHGVARTRAYTGRWDMVLGPIAKALQKEVLLAARRRRNYIVDLTNVSRDSRKKRLMHFKDFTKKCIVIIPDEEEMASRQMKQTRQEGVSHVPAEAILEMKAVFSIPSEEAEGIEEVHFIEPPIGRIAEAIEIVARFNEEGKPWYQKRYRGRMARRGGRGGFMGMGDRRGSDAGRPLSINTSGVNGSGPPSSVGWGGDRRSTDSPAPRSAVSTGSPSVVHSSLPAWPRKSSFN